MIGFYNYTVILTYLSLASSVIGMACAICGMLKWAVCCLAISGLFDAFDGRVARTKKDRTEDEKSFGIQIDSLCDMVCFGVFPVIICWNAGMNTALSFVILLFYCLAGLIRLAYYNVMEINGKQFVKDGKKYYTGLPITSVAVVLPIIFLISPLFENYFIYVMTLFMLLMGILFISNFKLKKPDTKHLMILIIIVAVIIVYLLYEFSWKEYFNWNIKDFFMHKFRNLKEGGFLFF